MMSERRAPTGTGNMKSINLGNNLYNLRKKRGLSQEEFAEKIHISRQAVSKWERGEAFPDIENLIEIAEFYGVTIDELVNKAESFDGVAEVADTGADILDGTPIYDIKPYLAFTDSHPDAVCGFADEVRDYSLEVVIPEELKRGLSDEYIKALISILSGDPRPQYKEDGDRVYGMIYGRYEVKFTVADGVLSVVEISRAKA